MPSDYLSAERQIQAVLCLDNHQNPREKVIERNGIGGPREPDPATEGDLKVIRYAITQAEEVLRQAYFTVQRYARAMTVRRHLHQRSAPPSRAIRAYGRYDGTVPPITRPPLSSGSSLTLA